MKETFTRTAEEYGAGIDVEITPLYHTFTVEKSEPVVGIARQAMQNLGIEPFCVPGGGMDGNRFNREGIRAIGIAPAYVRNHTNNETLNIAEFLQCGELVAEIVKEFTEPPHVAAMRRATRNCLRMGGYSEDKRGLEKAILEGFCVIYSFAAGEMRLLPPNLGHRYWKSYPNAQCTFNVNNPIALVSCATARRKDGSFVVDALCSDGGANPRNVIFRNGIKLVAARYISVDDLVRKASLTPSRMYGLLNKGHLSPGADGDVSVFDPLTGDALYAVTNGKIRMSHGVCCDDPGVAITTERGAKAVAKAGLQAYVADLEQSMYFRGRNAV